MNNAAECNSRRMETAVGAFALAVFVGLFVFTVVVSRDSIFSDKHVLTVEFDDIMGLRKGDSVIIRGLEVGRINELMLTDEKVIVTAMLDQAIELRDGYEVSVEISSVLGGRYMLIVDGSGAPLGEEASLTLQGTAPKDLMADATEIVRRIREALEDGDVIQNVERISANLAEISQSIRDGKGTAGKLVNSSELHDNLLAVSEDLKGISERLESGDGLLGKLLSEDDSLYTDLATAATSIREISEKVNNGEGTIGKMINDDELYTSLNSTAESLKTIADRIEAGEGSLGRFVNDDTLYVEAKEVMTEIRAAVDDFRETAPVVTFTSILFGAF